MSAQGICSARFFKPCKKPTTLVYLAHPRQLEAALDFRVLVVDDQKDLADTLAAMLSANGCTAKAVYSGADAVTAARTMRPHLLLTDIAMPGLNGLDTAIRIRRFLPTCKVLLISGNAKSVELWQSTRRKGFHFDLLMKPVAPEEMLAKLNSYR